MDLRIMVLYWIMVLLILLSCDRKQENTIDYAAIENELLQDTAFVDQKDLIRSIIEFYKNELPHHYSRRISLGTARNMVYLDELTDVQIDSIRDHLGPSTRIRFERVADNQFIDEAYLTQRIRHALSSAGKYPWNQSIPDSIFLNYLLPYKVMDEYPGNWWAYLEPHYLDTMALWSSPGYDRFDATDSRWVQRYTTFLMGDLPEWWHYDPMAQTYTKYPSLNEILLLWYGGCYVEAMINTLIQRTLGTPATIDEVPYWGSQNGSHASDVFWNAQEEKMRDELHKELYLPEAGRRPTKVIRYTYRSTGAFTNQIAPFLNGEELQIPQMKGNHWFDVTGEYSPVVDVHFSVRDKLPAGLDLGYIYVMNYGDWVPAHYGVRHGDSLRFDTMGTDLIYRIGYYTAGEHHFITRPFLLDPRGEFHYSMPTTDHSITIHVRKINMGKESDVVSGETYTLQYLDSEGNWHDHGTKQCQEDGDLVFEGVPGGAFYILRSPSDQRNLARIFLMNAEGEQVWY